MVLARELGWDSADEPPGGIGLLQAALLELLPAAARARIVPADALEPVRGGLASRRRARAPGTDATPLPIRHAGLRGGVPAREPAERIPERRDGAGPAVGRARGVREDPPEILAKAVELLERVGRAEGEATGLQST